MKKVFIVMGAILVIGFLCGIILLPAFFGAPKKFVCTMEAKLCPDGTAVGRGGPQCEFAKCPGEIKNDLWRAAIDDGKTPHMRLK